MNSELNKYILDRLPYRKPFLFVDEIEAVSENEIRGSYFFSRDEYFYAGHFDSMPVTPGVILLECMGQIGLVGLGIYLTRNSGKDFKYYPVLSVLEAEFIQPVFPETKVFVTSEKIYLRKNLFKAKIVMTNHRDEVIVKMNAICKFIPEL